MRDLISMTPEKYMGSAADLAAWDSGCDSDSSRLRNEHESRETRGRFKFKSQTTKETSYPPDGCTVTVQTQGTNRY